MQGAHLRCNRRITIARDHSAQNEAAQSQALQEAPATPLGHGKKKRKAINAETPSKAVNPDDGTELHLDDILAAEVTQQPSPAIFLSYLVCS